MTVDVTACRASLQARQRRRDREREALRQQVVQAVRDAARSVFPAFPQVRRAYLFGSMARRGAVRRDSDVDVAIEGELSAEAYFALWRELERAIPGRTVEVVELGPDLHFAERVRQTGEVIYACTECNRSGRPDSHSEG
jgi:predicted nucleotidyltransferase